MARPKKTGIDYFPFDVDFFEDEKLIAIAGEYGIKGEITAIKLLCAIYRNGYFIEWSEIVQLKLLRSLPGISAELLQQIVKRLVKWGFFDKSLFDSANILTSQGIQRRYCHSVRRRCLTEDSPYLLIDVAEKKPTEQQPEVQDVNKEETYEPLFSQTLDEEIKTLKAETCWLDQLQVNHKMPVETLIVKLDEFRAQCIADGKERGHQTLSDAKQHFNNWLRVLSNLKAKKNDTDKPNERAQRRSHMLSTTEKKTYSNSF